MYIADSTQTTLMQAINDLRKSTTAINAGEWAAKVLALLLSSAEVGALDANVAFLKANADKINKILGVCAEGAEAIAKASSALEMARTKIPNTTPPDPRGFESCGGVHLEQFVAGEEQTESFNESCSAPVAPVDEWVFVLPT
jgi:hypothetical protein